MVLDNKLLINKKLFIIIINNIYRSINSKKYIKINNKVKLILKQILKFSNLKI